MQALLLVASFLFLAAVLVYMHAVFNFYALVKVERPDWVDRRGSLGFFYTGMPPSQTRTSGWPPSALHSVPSGMNCGPREPASTQTVSASFSL